jgi:hypothetical protein
MRMRETVLGGVLGAVLSLGTAPETIGQTAIRVQRLHPHAQRHGHTGRGEQERPAYNGVFARTPPLYVLPYAVRFLCSLPARS